jgi:hypothetical protein
MKAYRSIATGDPIYILIRRSSGPSHTPHIFLNIFSIPRYTLDQACWQGEGRHGDSVIAAATADQFFVAH